MAMKILENSPMNSDNRISLGNLKQEVNYFITDSHSFVKYLLNTV